MSGVNDFGLLSPQYKNISQSSLIKSGVGKLRGIFVASALNTPTIQIFDNTSATSPILVNTFTPTAGMYYSFGDVTFVNGLYLSIGGTVDCTVFYF